MEYWQFVASTQESHRPEVTDQRYGQWYFNCLVQIRPDISEKIRSTKLDPFFREKVSQETEEFVEANW
jgi:hypothetical protein